MKKILMYGMALAGLAFASCQVETELKTPGPGNADSFRLQLSVDPIGTGVQTRATVPAVEGEENLINLTLLFFEHSTSRSGAFVKAYSVANPANGMLADLQIGVGEGVGLSHDVSYSILAYANYDSDFWNPSPAIDFPAFEGKTEAEVMEMITFIGQEAHNVQDHLPMAGRTSKMAGQDLVELELTRTVARIDVVNSVKQYYKMTSIGYVNAAYNSYLWSSDPTPNHRAQASHDVSSLIDDDKVTGGLYVLENFVGDPENNPEKTTALFVGLQALPGAPVGTAGETYYYRIDIRPEESAQNILRNNVYVVNIRGVLTEGSSDSFTAGDNVGIGKRAPGLDVVINNWDLDGEGMVLTDGQSTMAVPKKIVRFGPEAGSQTMSIFTHGPGELSITRSNLPDGFTASLNGKELTITATALPGDEERTGTFELGFGGLRGTVTVIQTPEIIYYLTVTPGTLDIFASVPASSEPIQVSASGPWTAELYNPAGDLMNPGFKFEGGSQPYEWDSDTDGGEAFTISPTGANATADVRFGFAVFTLAGHPEYRQVLILSQEAVASLRITPYFNQVPGGEDVMLFDMAGTPTPQGISGIDITGTTYDIAVNSGTNSGGLPNGWTATLTGADADRFALSVVDNTIYVSARGSENSDIPGLNLGGALNATLTIALDGIVEGEAVRGTHYFEIPVRQDPFAFTVTRTSGSLETVPIGGTRLYAKGDLYGDPALTGDPIKYVAGNLYGDTRAVATGTSYEKGDYVNFVEFEVDIPASLSWDAEIVDQSHDEAAAGGTAWKVHKGYLLNDTDQPVNVLTGQGSTKTLRVGFDKIYYPLIHWPDSPNVPKMQIEVTLTGIDEVATTVTVAQDSLVAKILKKNLWANSNTLDANNPITDGYGLPTGDLSTYYTTAYSTPGFYGPKSTNSVVRIGDAAALTFTDNTEGTWWTTGIASTWTTHELNDLRSLLVIGGTDIGRTWQSMEAFERWRTNPNTDGFIQYTEDEADGIWDFQEDNYNVTTRVLGWSGDFAQSTSDVILNTNTAVLNTRVMKYLLNGPFGAVNRNAIGDFYVDGYNNALLTAGPNTVPVIGIMDSDKEIYLAVDPVERVVYNGDVQQFYEDMDINNPEESPKFILLRNLTSMLINGAMYGSHFYDLLREDCPRPLYKIVSSSGNDVLTELDPAD